MIYLGDRITSVGLKLVGLKNSVPSNRNSIRADLTKISEGEDIILVSNKLFHEASGKIEEIRDEGKIVISIPDETGGGKDFLENLIRRAVGFDIRGTK